MESFAQVSINAIAYFTRPFVSSLALVGIHVRAKEKVRGSALATSLFFDILHEGGRSLRGRTNTLVLDPGPKFL